MDACIPPQGLQQILVHEGTHVVRQHLPPQSKLKHRVFKVSLVDLQGDEDHAFKKIRLRAENVQGKNVLTNLWGMDLTTDKLRSLVRKWQTLIEAHVHVKTIDNHTLRTNIHRKMREIMTNQATSCDLKELVRKFIPEIIGKDIGKATSSIDPVKNVFDRKVKILKAPKFDLGKLMEGGKIRFKLGAELSGVDGVVIEEGTTGDGGKDVAQKGMCK
ncbi:hypothetical protein JHK82_024276 [Glycine max]|uniref:40S ribosomal protein S3a n=2 Tax=Glycine subgen. Soja TaxID=1462606 RepID=K7LCA6_SOYBN|nr:hypothetical protein JHK85_024855 [Glycine max]KAG5012107.1 hypothetical protein JHK86_024368 [Glycine max]KAG5133088.1 hypothetical protein JHK82_024276 [Glycine max]KAH1041943.1 hypothetical protein GYH30_024324 [Glycine max]